MALTDAEKKTAVLVQLVKSGVVDLESFVDQAVKNMPADFDPDNPGLGSGAHGGAGCLIGPWCVVSGLHTD